MIIYEMTNCVEVITPKGDATILLVTDYGYETDKLYTCVIKETGELWEYPPKDIRLKNNFSIGRIHKPK